MRREALRVARPHRLEERQLLGLEPVRRPRPRAAPGRFLRAQVEPQRQVRLPTRLDPGFQLGQRGQVEAAASALVGEGGVRVAVAQHHGTARQRRLDHPAQVVAPGRKHQQRLGERIHVARQEQLAQGLGQRCAARFAGAHHFVTGFLPAGGDAVDLGGLARAVDAFGGDEAAGGTGEMVNFAQRAALRWNLSTARLWSASVSLNWLVPSPRATKYSALLLAGRIAAISESRPGMAIGVGGRPARV